MRTLAVYNRGLRIVNIELNSTITSYADLILLTLSKYSNLLEEFHFGPNPIFSDDAITVLLECCPELKVLDISDSSTITNELLWNIGRYGKNIEVLNISNGVQLSFKSFYDLRKCTKLKVLDVRGISKHVELIDDLIDVLNSTTQLEVVYYTMNGMDKKRVCI